ncbi:ankyrin repeat domain-containing protein [Burkholderia vietnamiensis]|uniref:Ankyrin n=1 Tax=Burkholderia vietnamiensis (strain G4 / LMG 22486) TaxID=269482 RepID=A4JFF5_BURVG|nr:Ankyrin [Burkholderia vietnamiensis G4]MCB4344766.1 ankyrin repeat domain-containing protein [Burkholderia vietnamiensis]
MVLPHLLNPANAHEAAIALAAALGVQMASVALYTAAIQLVDGSLRARSREKGNMRGFRNTALLAVGVEFFAFGASLATFAMLAPIMIAMGPAVGVRMLLACFALATVCSIGVWVFPLRQSGCRSKRGWLAVAGARVLVEAPISFAIDALLVYVIVNSPIVDSQRFVHSQRLLWPWLSSNGWQLGALAAMAIVLTCSRKRANAIKSWLETSAAELWSKSPTAKAVFAAAASGDIAQLQNLAKANIDWSATDRETKAALTLAAEMGHAQAVAWLLQRAPQLARQGDLVGRTPLMFAADKGHLDCVNLLLPHSDLLSESAFGFSSLVCAALEGHVDCVEAILAAAGPAAAAPNDKGFTALMGAAMGGSAAAVNALLPVSDAKLADHEEGMTALMFAARAGQAEAVEALLPQSDPQAVDSTGRTALLWAVDDECATLFKIGEVVGQQRAWVNKGAGQLTAAQSIRSIVEILRGENIARARCVRALLTASAVDAQDADGDTALHVAARLGRRACVNALLEAADASLRNADGQTALSCATVASFRHPMLMEEGLFPSDAAQEALREYLRDEVDDYQRALLALMAKTPQESQESEADASDGVVDGLAPLPASFKAQLVKALATAQGAQGLA